MNEMDVSRVLAQIRSLQAQASLAPATARVDATAAQPQGGFAGVLKAAIGEVNQSQNNAAALQRSFALGDNNADLSTVMLAGAKAQVEFKAMTEVRNRLVAAYQDIMNMPL
ncbi:flagellar hook-basal body complex protein FliE [Solimonas soli]|uniref:flagellar hook-basal body complex protein FliE n=1 Tax=Solimonas soli TaxID=413479 RepID=UPI0004846B2B|nr:flagellar hook-basal body complex protein FliE [Solimonas soli]